MLPIAENLSVYIVYSIFGARNAYVLAMDTIRQEKLKKDKAQQDEIDRKVEEYRKRQEKDSSEIKR